MIPALVVFAYLAIILYVGMFAFRRSTGSKEDFFLASRSLGPWVFLLTVFGTNMTAFAILGSSGLGYMPVMFLCLGSAGWMFLVSLLTPAPSPATLRKFFPVAEAAQPSPRSELAGSRT